VEDKSVVSLHVTTANKFAAQLGRVESALNRVFPGERVMSDKSTGHKPSSVRRTLNTHLYLSIIQSTLNKTKLERNENLLRWEADPYFIEQIPEYTFAFTDSVTSYLDLWPFDPACTVFIEYHRNTEELMYLIDHRSRSYTTVTNRYTYTAGLQSYFKYFSLPFLPRDYTNYRYMLWQFSPFVCLIYMWTLLKRRKIQTFNTWFPH